MRRVTIFDTDGKNPYGREVATLIAAHVDVKALLPSDVGWVPDGLCHRPILPANGPAKLLAQLVRQLRGVLSVAWDALVRRRLIVVIMTRAWYDELAFVALCLLGARFLVVAHDPVSKTPLARHREFVRRLFWHQVNTLVVHSGKLAADAQTISGRPAHVVPHLPFLAYSEWTERVAPNVKAQGRLRFLVLGQMRPDKGLERLPMILDRVVPAYRQHLSIAFAGKGDLDKLVATIAAFITVTRPISKNYLNDRDIAASLAESDVLIAPYPVASASGSVVLALCRGLRVVAYDAGSIRDVLADNGLVQPHDEAAFAAQLSVAPECVGGGPRLALPQWRNCSLDAWLEALRHANG